MTERTHDSQVDDQALAEYLNGGSSVSQRYRASVDDAVPPELDHRVSTRARHAAKSEKSRAWLRWTAPLAAAASALVVLSIVLDQGVREQAAVTLIEAEPQGAPDAAVERRAIEEGPEPQVQLAPPPAAASPQPQMKSEAPQFKAPQEVRPAAPPPLAVAPEYEEYEQARALRKRVERDSASARRSEDLAASTPATHAEIAEVVVAGQSSPPGSMNSPAAISMDATQAIAVDASALDPKRWLQEIRELREQGRNEEADREWDRFRGVHPDYAVAETDTAPPRR